MTEVQEVQIKTSCKYYKPYYLEGIFSPGMLKKHLSEGDGFFMLF